MTTWIVLITLTLLLALPFPHARQKEPRLPPGYEGERQLAELRALAVAEATTRFP